MAAMGHDMHMRSDARAAGWLASSASAAAPASFCRVLPSARVVHAALAPRPGSCRHIMSSRLRGA